MCWREHIALDPACNGSVDGIIINQIQTKSDPQPRPSGNADKKKEATEAQRLVLLQNARVENRRDGLEQDAFLKLLSLREMKDRARRMIQMRKRRKSKKHGNIEELALEDSLVNGTGLALMLWVPIP